MHILHRRLDEDTELRDAVSGLSERIRGNPLKHALILDLNPVWLTCYQIWAAGYDPDLLIRHWPVFPSWSFLELNGLTDSLDLEKRFNAVDHFTMAIFGRGTTMQPYMLRIYSKPILEPNPSLLELRAALVTAARDAKIPTVVEIHTPARLIGAPGDRILSSTGNIGTLGGFLKDPAAGTVYGMTCGHVISSGTALTPAGLLGSCVKAVTPVALPAGVSCCTGCNHMTEIDLALIQVQGATPVNKATSIAQTVSNKQLVVMDGATTGSVRYEIGGAVVEQEIDGSCWTRLYQVHAPVSASILPVSVNVAITTLPANGDSGSWLLRGGSEWAGMVVAADALHGYALAATTLQAEANKLTGTALALA
jgi:hypothetical protein